MFRRIIALVLLTAPDNLKTTNHVLNHQSVNAENVLGFPMAQYATSLLFAKNDNKLYCFQW